MVIARYVIAGIWLGYLLAWAVAILVPVILAAMLFITMGPSQAVRGGFRRLVAARDRSGSLHLVGQARDPASLAGAIRELRAADPGFDVMALMDSARVAVGAYVMAAAGKDDRLLRRITTPGYWQTPNGKEIALGVAEWRRYTHGKSVKQGWILLDLSWRQPQVCGVVLAEQGLDRITVRLNVVQVTAIPASWEILGGAAKPGWKRIDVVTNLDWEFVRPAGQRTDPGAVLLPVTCPVCGGPYRSDLDDACPHCGMPRPDAQAGWRLDCTYQVVTS